MIIFNIPISDYPIDIESSEWLAAFITKRFRYNACDKHIDSQNEIAIKSSDGNNFASPMKFCCPDYQDYAMRSLEAFLTNPS